MSSTANTNQMNQMNAGGNSIMMMHKLYPQQGLVRNLDHLTGAETVADAVAALWCCCLRVWTLSARRVASATLSSRDADAARRALSLTDRVRLTDTAAATQTLPIPS